MLYLSLTARPDIAQCVGVLSRFMACPGEAHVTAAQQAIKYLYATRYHGITYTRGVHGAPHVFMSAHPGDEVDSESSVNRLGRGRWDPQVDDWFCGCASWRTCILDVQTAVNGGTIDS